MLGVFDRRASPLAVMDRRSGDAESFWTGSKCLLAGEPADGCISRRSGSSLLCLLLAPCPRGAGSTLLGIYLRVPVLSGEYLPCTYMYKRITQSVALLTSVTTGRYRIFLSIEKPIVGLVAAIREIRV